MMQGCCRWGAWDITSSLEPLLTQSRTNESVVMAVKTTHTGHLIEFFRRERYSDHCVNNISMAMDRNKKHVRRRNGVSFLWQCFLVAMLVELDTLYLWHGIQDADTNHLVSKVAFTAHTLHYYIVVLLLMLMADLNSILLLEVDFRVWNKGMERGRTHTALLT